MAPEQIHGKNEDRNERADIYALGCLLYTLLTLEKSFDGDSGKEIIIKTVTEPLIPPRERTPDRIIPKSIEAVTLKALAFKQEERYQTVPELVSDIDAFLGGYATSAEKANWGKHIFLMIKRHRAVSFIFSLLLITGIMFGTYVTINHHRQWGNWNKVYAQDFTEGKSNTEKLLFLDQLIEDEMPAWITNQEGIKMEKMHWLWLKDIKIRGDNKIVVRMLCTGRPEAFEICINSRIEAQFNDTHVPPGYSFQFGAWKGLGNIISKNIKSQLSDTTNSSTSSFVTGKIHELIIERKNGKISMTVDGKKSIEIIDYFPLKGKNYSNIGFRSYSPSTYLKSIEVYRWALPEQASPLLAGDTLSEYQFTEEAVAKYLTIAEDQKGTEIASEALLKAYLSASSNDVSKQAETMKNIKEKMNKQFPGTGHLRELLEQEVLYYWKNSNHSKVLSLLPKLFKTFPDNKVMLKVLQLKHNELPEETGQELLSWIQKSKGIRELNISGLGLTSIDKLRGMKLNAIDCSRNPMGKLDALSGMSLTNLNCSKCNISSIDPLRGMKLRDLIISNNKISDLTPLKGMPIERLRCRLNTIASIAPLKGMPLKRLECGGNKITDLAPLEGAPLIDLGCRMNQIKSLDPLKKMKLWILDCQINKIEDITPLANMPLKELFLNHNPIKDLKPLKLCKELEKLTIPEEHGNIEFLKDLPSIKYLDTKWNIPLKKADRFWEQQ